MERLALPIQNGDEILKKFTPASKLFGYRILPFIFFSRVQLTEEGFRVKGRDIAWSEVLKVSVLERGMRGRYGRIHLDCKIRVLHRFGKFRFAGHVVQREDGWRQWASFGMVGLTPAYLFLRGAIFDHVGYLVEIERYRWWHWLRDAVAVALLIFIVSIVAMGFAIHAVSH